MTTSSANKSQRNRLQSIAADYEVQGYDVKVQPSPGDLPEFLTGFEPDLIAVGKGETLVVEVKTRGELADISSVTKLEAVLRGRPGWRFELIVDGPGTPPQPTLNAIQIRATMEEATELQRRQHLAAALMLLWSATEGALRLLAEREDLEMEYLASRYLVNRLYMVLMLGRDQYKALDETMRLRTQAAHGFQTSVAPEDLARITAVLNELLSEVETAAA